MVLYEVIKFCNLFSDQSQFETRKLNNHWIDTNNTPWLGFLMFYFNWKSLMGIHGILAFLMDYVNISLFILWN